MLCTDRNMMIPALFVAHSVIRQARSALSGFDVVIVTDQQAVDQRHAEWMKSHGILHKVIDFQFLRDIFEDAGRLTAATLVKLALAEIFADGYDRILYLDSDLTIHADVSVLFDLDLGGHAVAANPRAAVFLNDAERKETETRFHELGMTRPYRFFNSGVLLIDVAKWNEQDLTCRTLDFIMMNREICPLPDEHGLNAVLNGKFAALSPVWNMPPRREPFMELHDLVQAAIVHYSGHDKPWKRFGRDKPLLPDQEAYLLYRQFITGSPWPDWLDRQWNLHDLGDGVRSMLSRHVRKWLGSAPGDGAGSDEGFLERVAIFYSEAEFADVSQGLTLRSGSRLTRKC